jgi:uncharacterized protein YjbI with pentapeptide repeats
MLDDSLNHPSSEVTPDSEDDSIESLPVHVRFAISYVSIREEEFEALHFRSCTFAGTDARNAKFIDCSFTGCALSAVKLENATFQAKFEESKIEGINFFTARRATLSLSFDRCLIRHSSFADLKIKNTKFTHCTFQHVDFADADLAECDFSNSTFEECTFQNTNLSKTDFRGAQGYAIDPRINKLLHARFDVPEVLSLLSVFRLVIE